jgi:MT0933-like antitoxin protein
MGIFDKAKDALSEHSEQVDQGIDKGGDLIDEKTGSKYVGQVDKGQEFAKDRLGGPENDPAQPPA